MDSLGLWERREEGRRRPTCREEEATIQGGGKRRAGKPSCEGRYDADDVRARGAVYEDGKSRSRWFRPRETECLC